MFKNAISNYSFRGGKITPNGRPIRSVLEYDGSFSETELRAAQPNLHSGRLRSLLQVAAR